MDWLIPDRFTSALSKYCQKINQGEIVFCGIKCLNHAFSHFRLMCIRFAELERKLGEIDRARAIYAHCSQMCDPRVSSALGLGGLRQMRGANDHSAFRYTKSSGRFGRISKSSTAMKIPFARCCVSDEVCKPRTIRRSILWRRRCWRRVVAKLNQVRPSWMF